MEHDSGSFRCLEVHGDRTSDDSAIEQRLTLRRTPDRDAVPDDWVLVQIHFSSVNYKDALAATGHPGVARNLPLVPGIDAVGQVIESKSDLWSVGDRVIINSDDFGTAEDGGWRRYAWIPAAWLVKSPQSLSDQEIACLGTAGITAAWCVDALKQHGVLDAGKPIVVTGATGGVGSIAVEILGKRLGQEVVAISGKTDQFSWLQEIGASKCIERDQFVDHTPRPLLSGRWAGGVDTVGSASLSSLLRSLDDGGCVAACGLAGGPELNLTVYPFILRGAILYGIDCTRYSQQAKAQMWEQLGSQWRPEIALQQAKTVSLSQASKTAFSLLDGTHVGRTVIDLAMDS